MLASAALRDRVEPLALSTLVATGAAGAFALAHAVHGGAPIHTATAALAVVALALVPTAFAVSAFLSGLGRIGPSRASIASSLEPAVAVACGVLVLGERLVPAQFLGAGLVVAAVLAIELRQLPRVPLPPLPRVRLFPRLVPRLPRPDALGRPSSGWGRRACARRGGSCRPCARARSTRARPARR